MPVKWAKEILISRHNMSLHPACLVSRLPTLEARLQELCRTPVPLRSVSTFPLNLIEGSQDSLSSLCRRIQAHTELSLNEAGTIVLEQAKRTAYGVILPGTDVCESQEELCYWVWEGEETTQPTSVLTERKLIGTVIRKLHFAIQRIKRLAEGNETVAMQEALEEYQAANQKWASFKQRSCKRSREEEKSSSEAKKPKITPRISLEGTSLLSYFSAEGRKEWGISTIPLPLFNYFHSKEPPAPFLLPADSPAPGGDWHLYLKSETRHVKAPSKVLNCLYGTPLQFQLYRPREPHTGKLRRNPFVRYSWVDYDAESEQVRVR